MKTTRKLSALAMAVLGGVTLLSPQVASAASHGSKSLSYYLGNTKPFSKPVKISIGWTTAGPQGLPKGQSQSNNDYVKYIDKKLNVNLQYAWFVPPTDYTYQKDSLAISSNDIPDVMEVNYPLLKQLEAANMIEPLTSAFNQNASQFVKDYYKTAHNLPLKMASENGQLMAIPDVQIGYQYDLLWVRKDWMNKLHLKAPKTMADVAKMAKDFISHKMGGQGTIGIAGRPSISNYFPGATLDGLIQSYGAYPGVWLNQHGKVVYGSVQPQMRTALLAIHNLYAQGLIDPQFATRSAQDEIALANTGKTGIFIAPWWVTFGDLQPDLSKQWVAYPAPLDSHGKYNVEAPSPSGNFIVVKKGFSDPAAVVKVLNLSVAGYRNENPATNNLYKGLNVQWTQWPLSIDLDNYDAIPREYREISKALKAKSSAGLSGQALADYNTVMQYRSNPNKNLSLWGTAMARTVAAGATYQSEKLLHQVHPLTLVPDQKYAAQASALQTLEAQDFLGIVAGQYPISKFDEFVQQWHKEGGDAITASYQAQFNGK